MSSNPVIELTLDELRDQRRVWAGASGSHEEGLGRLALLTDERVLEAAVEEIQTGQRVGLNWSLAKSEYPGLGRAQCEPRIVSLLDDVRFDDIYKFNPQQNSQWDGLRHFGMPVSSCSQSHSNPERSSSPRRIDEQRVFYGDTANDEILDRTSDMIGVQHWAQEGITGRGVLIDYVSWAEKQGIKYSALSCHSIGLCDILDIAVEQNVSFKRGDILLIRCGFTKEWDGMSLEAKKSYAELETPEHAGIEATTAVLEWICNTGLAAVAGDAVSFEVLPPTADFMLHEYLIAGWGMPIGGMFNLEGLAGICKELGRFTFFFTSMPLNMSGGASSPPNAQAIF